MLELKQGSPEWHAWRRQHICASDVATIMGCGFMTRQQLLDNKRGLYEPPVNAHMQRGIKLENIARDHYEVCHHYFSPMRPCCVESGIFGASLDGLSVDGKTILEIKCPSDKGFEEALLGIIPEKYQWQMEMQLFVSGADIVHYLAFFQRPDGYDEFGVQVDFSTKLLHYRSDPDKRQRMLEACHKFWDELQERQEDPELGADVEQLCAQYMSLAEQIRGLEEAKEALRSAIIAKTDDGTCRAGGYLIERGTRKGSVDYGRIPQLDGVDLERFRKPDTVVWNIKKQKNKD